MVKNLNQLKKALKKGVRFEITGHCLPEYVGQKREVTVSNTQGFYSIIPGEPGSRVSLANNGRGSVLWWSKAPFWEFKDGVCSIYSSVKKRTEDCLIMSFRIEGEAS